MADRIVQPKVLASTNPDTYDNLIMQQAQNATNVTTNINGNAISDIFENNGTIVKQSTLSNFINIERKTDLSSWTNNIVAGLYCFRIRNRASVMYSSIFVSIYSSDLTSDNGIGITDGQGNTIGFNQSSNSFSFTHNEEEDTLFDASLIVKYNE